MHRSIATSAVVAMLLAGCAAGSATAPPAATTGPSPSVTPATSGPVPSSPAKTPAPATPAVSPPAAEGPITLAPGEAWLAYRWYPQSLFLVRPDGSDRHRLDLGVEGEPLWPAWSPDGERLAFVLRDDATTPADTIWTANGDGTGAAHLYGDEDHCDGGADYPVWSPDGSRLALVCYQLEGPHGVATIATLDLATMEQTEIVRLAWPEFTDNPPAWSPDGSTIAFDILTWDPTDTQVTSMLVATVPATGGEIRRLTDPALFAAHPDWSPDGRLIAFNTYDTGNIHGIEEPSNVYTIAPDGTGLRQLSTASTDGTMRLGQPFWSTDGSRIWVSIGRDWEKDSTGQFMNTLGWVDAATGAFYEIGTEGKSFRERPALP
jgi:Tol biopolymer transport system component